MTYVLKLHISRLFFGSFVNNAKVWGSGNYICGHCLRQHTPFYSERRSSSYVGTLKLLLKKKEKNRKLSLISKHSLTKKDCKRFTELLKVTMNKSQETRMKIQQLKASDITAFAEEPGMTFAALKYQKNWNYDSIRTYDPNLIIHREGIVKFDDKTLALKELKPHKLKINSKNTEDFADYYLYNRNYKNSIKVKIKPNSNPKRKKQVKNNNVDLEVKSLPLSSVEIFPMPEKLQKDISKKSERAIKELPKPVNAADIFVKPQELDLSFLTSNTEEKETKVDDEEKSMSLLTREFASIEISNLNKAFVLAQMIESYIDVAVSNNMLDNGLNMLFFFRKKKIWDDIVNRSEVLNAYNVLLHSYSLKGDWVIVKKIILWMELDNLKFTAQTYAGILDCLGRMDKKVFHNGDFWTEEVTKTLKDLYKNNLSLNDLFTKTTLSKDKQDKILETVRAIVPFFEIEATKTKLSNNCTLLTDLNKGLNRLVSPLGNDYAKETLERSVEEQLLVEKNGFLKVKSVYYKDCLSPSQVGLGEKKQLETLNEEWRNKITDSFISHLKNVKLEHSTSPHKFNLYIYLTCLPVKSFVDVMMETVKTVIAYSGGYSPNITALHQELGDKIFRRYQIKKKISAGVLDTTETLFKKYCAWYLDPVGPATNSRQQWEMLMQDFPDGQTMSEEEIKWPTAVRISLGKYLYDIILRDVQINVGKSKSQDKFIPVFYSILRCKKMKNFEEIKCHPLVTKLFKAVGREYLNFDADQIPMLCPPKPWKTVDHGGYLIFPTVFIRQPQENCQKNINLKKFPDQQLYPVFDSLNFLQSVPWTINEKVLDVALEVFQNGGSDDLDVPKLPDDSPLPVVTYDPKMSLEDRYSEYNKKRQVLLERQNQYGLWCEALYRLSLANHFRNKIFWLPENLDFRGRVYPVPPHLNHVGADLYRSLLVFAKGKPLGPKGFDWIKIHTINLTGTHKKRSLEERLAYANSILPEILDSAERPLTGNKWWMKSEEPWQTLASCMEIKKVMSSPDPESYVSNFPIHQDGSCNGLQHYAALGRDKIGAKSVNLSPSEKPQDVYSLVTEIIEQKRAEDAKKGLKISQIVDGFIIRKVFKQTIMTTVYGVTLYGAREQIARQLRDIKEFPKEHVWLASGYLVKLTFGSLQEVFTSAKEIQDWFLRCSDEICKKRDHVKWISPLGLPIMQPYGKILSQKVEAKELDCKTTKRLRVPNRIKQKNAFAPNFIHSLDSSHMMLTGLFCEQAGLTFGTIHDCFWTHPSTVDTMNRICREQFVSLYSQPILENLSKFFINCYIKTPEEEEEPALPTFLAIPKRGSFDLDSILKSVYFFS